MIQMSVTAAGLAAIAGNDPLTFTRFLAGSGADEDGAAVQQPTQEVPIAHTTTYVAGQTYPINGQNTQVDYNSTKFVGVLDTSLAQSAYQWNELALLARVGSDDQETTIAYGTATYGSYPVDPSDQNTFVINFELIYSDSPQVTVETTQTGVTWADHLQHTDALVSGATVHGLRYTDGTLYINGAPMPAAQAGEVLAITGVDSIVSAWPEPNLAWLDKLVLNRVDQSLKRLVKSEILHEGQFIYPTNGSWSIGDGTEAGTLLVVSDEVSPSVGEIALSDAQLHFLAWQDVDTIERRLRTLEETTIDDALTVEQPDSTVYNGEWVYRMTGSGTEASPYRIYTPYDFNLIRNDTNAVYVLANNLDFSDIIGMDFRVEGGVLVRGGADETAPLYRNGNGFEEINTFSGVLDGNGKIVRGLTCCGDVRGFIRLLDNARVQNLTLKDGFIVCTNDWWDENCTGSIAGYTAGSVYIWNCNNFNTVMSTCTRADKERHVGGLIGCADMINNPCHISIKNCANHGKLYNFSTHATGSVCGIVGNVRNNYNTDVSCTINSCYNSSSLDCKNVAGIAAKWSGQYLAELNCGISNCYNSGILQGETCWSITNSQIASGGGDDVHITDCWARDDYGTSVSQVHIIDPDDMRVEAFLEQINANLTDTAYVADDTNANSGFPILVHERTLVTGIPGSLPVALLDAAKTKILGSGMTFDALRDYASKPEIRRLKALLSDCATQSDLSTLEGSVAATYATQSALQIVQQSMPLLLQTTLAVGDWVQDSGLIYQDISQAGVTSSSTVLLVPQSADHFTVGLSAGMPSADSIRILASSLPAADISVGIVVAG